MPRQPRDLLRQLAERIPARPDVRSGDAVELLGNPRRIPAVGHAREPLELGERQPERLAHVADRAAAPVGREARDQRGMLAAVALRDADDQLLADVAGKVEVDVGHGRHLVVDEPAEREPGGDRVDVREPGEVADDRADARAAAAAGWERVPGAAGAAHLERAGAGQLEHLPVQQEEARETEPPDQRQLLVEPLPRTPLVAVGIRVALGERAAADLAQLHVGRVDPVGEVGVAVAELLGEVEGAALGDLARAQRRLARQPLEHLRGRAEHRFVVPAPLLLAAVERRPAANRDEHVLEAERDADGAHARRPWRPWALRAAPRARRASRCDGRRRARTAAAARRRRRPERRGRAGPHPPGRGRPGRSVRSRRARPAPAHAARACRSSFPEEAALAPGRAHACPHGRR